MATKSSEYDRKALRTVTSVGKWWFVLRLAFAACFVVLILDGAGLGRVDCRAIVVCLGCVEISLLQVGRIYHNIMSRGFVPLRSQSFARQEFG